MWKPWPCLSELLLQSCPGMRCTAGEGREVWMWYCGGEGLESRAESPRTCCRSLGHPDLAVLLRFFFHLPASGVPRQWL